MLIDLDEAQIADSVSPSRYEPNAFGVDEESARRRSFLAR
jgi:hypothetical protein